MPKTRQAPSRHSEGQQDKQSYSDEGAAGPDADGNRGFNPHIQGRPGSAFNEQQAFGRSDSGFAEGDTSIAEPYKENAAYRALPAASYASGIFSDAQQSAYQNATLTSSNSAITTQNHGSSVDPQLWVRIPYPLSSYFQQPVVSSPANINPDRQIPASGHNESVNADSIYRTRGWFDLGATQMRELTVESVENAGSSVNAEPSIKPQVNRDEHE